MHLPSYCSVSERCDGKFHYVCWGAAVTEVGVDVLTGETRVERVDILYDCGDRWAGIADMMLHGLAFSVVFLYGLL